MGQPAKGSRARDRADRKLPSFGLFACIADLLKKPDEQVPEPDFNIIARGWNPLMGLLLPHTGGVPGIPMMTSTPETRGIANALLHQLGRYSLLKQTSDMLRYGIADGEAGR